MVNQIKKTKLLKKNKNKKRNRRTLLHCGLMMHEASNNPKLFTSTVESDHMCVRQFTQICCHIQLPMKDSYGPQFALFVLFCFVFFVFGSVPADITTVTGI